MGYKGIIVPASYVVDKFSYEGGAPQSRLQQLEVRGDQLVTLINKLPGLPIRTEHNGVVAGRILQPIVRPGGALAVDFELEDNVKGHLLKTMVEAGLLTGLSLKHNRVTGEPEEVSLVFQGARDGSVLYDQDTVAASNLNWYKEESSAGYTVIVVQASASIMAEQQQPVVGGGSAAQVGLPTALVAKAMAGGVDPFPIAQQMGVPPPHEMAMAAQQKIQQQQQPQGQQQPPPPAGSFAGATAPSPPGGPSSTGADPSQQQQPTKDIVDVVADVVNFNGNLPKGTKEELLEKVMELQREILETKQKQSNLEQNVKDNNVNTVTLLEQFLKRTFGQALDPADKQKLTMSPSPDALNREAGLLIEKVAASLEQKQKQQYQPQPSPLLNWANQVPPVDPMASTFQQKLSAMRQLQQQQAATNEILSRPAAVMPIVAASNTYTTVAPMQYQPATAPIVMQQQPFFQQQPPAQHYTQPNAFVDPNVAAGYVPTPPAHQQWAHQQYQQHLLQQQQQQQQLLQQQVAASAEYKTQVYDVMVSASEDVQEATRVLAHKGFSQLQPRDMAAVSKNNFLRDTFASTRSIRQNNKALLDFLEN